MNTLPTEIASSIVSHVDQGDFYSLSLVNRQFYTVTNPLLWRTVKMGNALKFLKFLQATLLSGGCFFRHSPSCRHHQCHYGLRWSTLSSTSVTLLARMRSCVTPLLTALTACPLEEISIDAVSTRDDQAARQFARALATFSHLEVLALREIDQVLSRHLLVTMDRKTVPWPRLTVCYLQGCDDMEDQDVIRFIKTHPHLEKLELSGNDFTDTVLYAIADTLPRLTYLDLSASWEFTHHGVRRIVLKCPLLTHFVLDSTQLKRSDFPELGPYSDEHLAEFPDDLEWATQLGDLCQHHMDIIRRAANDNNDDVNGSDE
ncbi:unnamed protein product [Absidia cylindrospora]